MFLTHIVAFWAPNSSPKQVFGCLWSLLELSVHPGPPGPLPGSSKANFHDFCTSFWRHPGHPFALQSLPFSALCADPLTRRLHAYADRLQTPKSEDPAGVRSAFGMVNMQSNSTCAFSIQNGSRVDIWHLCGADWRSFSGFWHLLGSLSVPGGRPGPRIS